MHPNDERLQRIEDKLDRTLEYLSELEKNFAVHVTEDRVMLHDLTEVKKALPALQKTALAAKICVGLLVTIVTSAGAWATGLVDILKLLGKK